MTSLEALVEQYDGVNLVFSKALYPRAEGSGLPLIHVTTDLCEAVISLQGAQLLEFKSAGEPPLLWLSPQCQFNPGKALRGGIPICLPWFGPHPTDTDKPQHGFARATDWDLTQIAQSDDGRCEFWFELRSGENDLFENPFLAELRMVLGRQVELELSITNQAKQAVDFTWALHSYFPVSSLERVRVPALASRDYFDNLEDRTRKPQKEPLAFTGEVDRIFPAVNHPVVIQDSYPIRIEHQNCPSVIAWNPGPEKAAKMADVGAGTEQQFICIERGAVLDEGWRLKPEEKRSGKIIISKN